MQNFKYFPAVTPLDFAWRYGKGGVEGRGEEENEVEKGKERTGGKEGNEKETKRDLEDRQSIILLKSCNEYKLQKPTIQPTILQ